MTQYAIGIQLRKIKKLLRNGSSKRAATMLTRIKTKDHSGTMKYRKKEQKLKQTRVRKLNDGIWGPGQSLINNKALAHQYANIK